MRIVITGASRGIGGALAGLLRKRGNDVWSISRSAEGMQCSKCDVAEWSQISAARDVVAANWDSIDAIICAAALQGQIGAAMNADPVRWSDTVRANLHGTFFVIRAFWELVRKSPRRGKIICFSGGGATSARPGFSAYAASKTAVVRLVENLAAEWKNEPVDINAIAPGAINTDMTREIVASGPHAAGAEEHARAQRQLQEGGQSMDRVAALVEWLLSSASDGINGRLLSAQWDNWENLPALRESIARSDVFQLRRILPSDRALPL
jgi:3-oxoacyl-[acyl-carrier protein] reductase